MPFVQGETLRDRLTREKQLPVTDALRIAREVADALGYAHANNIVHRDIKPGNILLSAGHAVVADFGIARAITASAGDQLTETGLAVGTPDYMSPEQATGETGLDGRTDVYALGCVLYEMLAGDPPFQARRRRRFWPVICTIRLRRSGCVGPTFLLRSKRLDHRARKGPRGPVLDRCRIRRGARIWGPTSFRPEARTKPARPRCKGARPCWGGAPRCPELLATSPKQLGHTRP